MIRGAGQVRNVAKEGDEVGDLLLGWLDAHLICVSRENEIREKDRAAIDRRDFILDWKKRCTPLGRNPTWACNRRER